jgi:hypothetical protein
MKALASCLVLIASTALAQAPAPIPPVLAAAHKVFVSNAGADSGLFPEPFSGSPDRGYNQLYSALQASGKYELVTDPSQADVVLELQLTAPSGPARASKQLGASDPVPMFRLVVYDAKSHFVLWAFTQSIEIAFLQKTHDKNFDEALNSILLEFEGITGKAAK